MSYCPNPVCAQPQNDRHASVCADCGTLLVLGDRYRLLRPIGQGGFGATFLAVDETLPGRDRCVVKQFLPQLQGRDTASKAAALFQEEADRLAALGDHPQIPQLLDRFSQADYQYLVQEWIDGQTLEAELAEQGPFGEAQIWAVLKAILPILDFIHGFRVIHRDVKPANLIRRYGDRRLFLVDFGASKYATGTALARTGTVIGSAGYAAPEQAMGKAVFASDLYSLGVTCLHLLTGQHPFDLYSVAEDDWVWSAYVSSPVSDRLGRVLNRLIERPISRRYATASEVLEDIRRSRPRSLLPSDRPTGWRCSRIFAGHEGSITAIALSADGAMLASGSRDQSIKLWALYTGKLIHSFEGRSLWNPEGHSAPVRSLAFTADGQRLVSGAADGSVRLWDVVRCRGLGQLPVQSWGVTAIALGSQPASSQEHLAIGSEDGTLQLWDLENRQPWATVRGSPFAVLQFSQDGRLLVGGGDRTVRLWQVTDPPPTLQLCNTLKAVPQRANPMDTVQAIALSQDRQWLVTAAGQMLRLWNVEQGRCSQTILAHRAPIHGVALSANGQFLASGGEDSLIQLGRWDEERQCFQSAGRLKTPWAINALVFSPDGYGLISAGADETLQLWQYEPLGP